MRLTRRIALTAPIALAACHGDERISLPFYEANDHLIAPVIIGGRKTLALIDNGAPSSSLDRRFASSAGLVADAAGAGLQPLDVRLGAASLRLHPFTEDMAEAAIAADATVGAFLGMELFRAFAPEFVFSRSELILHPRGRLSPANGAQRLRTDLGDLPHPRIDIEIEGINTRAFVDLGCSSALAISAAFARRIGIDDGRVTSTRQVILSKADGLQLGVSRLTSVLSASFAGSAFRDIPIDVLPSDAVAFGGLDAVIGVPLLRKFDLAFDLPGRIWIAANSRIAQPFERRMTGLQTRPEGSTLLVRHVAAGSPAEVAAFQAGDRIAEIDGAPPLMRTLRTAREGQVLTIRLADGRKRPLTGARYY